MATSPPSDPNAGQQQQPWSPSSQRVMKDEPMDEAMPAAAQPQASSSTSQSQHPFRAPTLPGPSASSSSSAAAAAAAAPPPPTSAFQPPEPSAPTAGPAQSQDPNAPSSTSNPIRPATDPSLEAHENRRRALLKRQDEDQRKDRTLAELLRMLDSYTPVIPDEVTDYYLQRSGFESGDARLNRLLSLTTEKFLADIVSDAYQYSRIRSSSSTTTGAAAGAAAVAAQQQQQQQGPGAGQQSQQQRQAGEDRNRTVLTMDDLSAALAEYGVNARRSDSYR